MLHQHSDNNMKEIIILALTLCALFVATDARSKVSHALGKRFRLHSHTALSDIPRRLSLPRFAATGNQNIFGDIARTAGAAALQSALPPGYAQPYPAGYPQQYPAGYPQQYAGYPQQYPVGYTPSPEEAGEEGVSTTAVPAPNLAELEQDQNKAEEKLEKAQQESEKLKLALDQLSSSAGVNERKGVHIETDVVTPAEVEEAETQQSFEKAATPKSPFTAPVIVLLPPETTPRDKLEFARALACKGKGKIGENAKLAEMASIKGRTKKELEDEMKQTEKKLEQTKKDREKLHDELRKVETQAVQGANVKADIEFLKSDLEDKDKEIETLIKKLKTLENRRDALNIVVHNEDKKEKEKLKEDEEEKTKEKKHSKFRNLFKRKHKKEKEEEAEEEEE